MKAKAQSVAVRRPCHLIPGRVEGPEPCHQQAHQKQPASYAEVLRAYLFPVSLDDLLLNFSAGFSRR